MATPTAPVTSTVTAPTPGAKTSEGVFTALSILLGALPAILQALGIKENVSPLVQAVGLILSGLSGIHFTAQRSMLKRAHLAASTALSVPSAPARLVPVVPAGLVAAAAATAILAILACGGGTPKALAPVVAGAGSAGAAFISCEGVNLNADITLNGKTLTVLSAIGEDLLSANFLGAIADLLATLGEQVVACGVIAAEDFEQSLAGGSGSAITTSALAPNQQELLEHARAVHAKYRWVKLPKATARYRAPGDTTTGMIDQRAPDAATVRRQMTAGSGAAVLP